MTKFSEKIFCFHFVDSSDLQHRNDTALKFKAPCLYTVREQLNAGEAHDHLYSITKILSSKECHFFCETIEKFSAGDRKMKKRRDAP